MGDLRQRALVGLEAISTRAVVARRAVPAVAQEGEGRSGCAVRRRFGRGGALGLGYRHHAFLDDGVVVRGVELATVLRAADQDDSGAHGRERSTRRLGRPVLPLAASGNTKGVWCVSLDPDIDHP
jgi:hypothetical protein